MDSSIGTHMIYILSYAFVIAWQFCRLQRRPTIQISLNSVQNTLLSVAIITIKWTFFFTHTSSATLTISSIKLNTLKTEAGITYKEQMSETYIIVFSILYSVTIHSYSSIFNTKINKWVWGTVGISTCIQLHITHTLVMNTRGKRAQNMLSVITVHM